MAPEEHGYLLRWFTPTVEVDLCGHATLASAHALWEQGYVRPAAEDPLLHAQWNAHRVPDRAMDRAGFSRQAGRESGSSRGLEEGLGAALKYVGRNAFDYLVELDSEETVRKLKPNFALLEKLPVRGCDRDQPRGRLRFRLALFPAPASGIREDPVTGSAHVCLGPYWGPKLGRRRR